MRSLCVVSQHLLEVKNLWFFLSRFSESGKSRQTENYETIELIARCMGCLVSKKKDDMGNAVAVASEANASNTSSANVNYKSRLEWKMCVVSTVVLCKFSG